nr:hypothetical protein [uncultured Moraxella sp.]
MATYTVKYQKTGSNTVLHMTINASSASQAKEQVKSKYNGQVKIISAVER